MIAYGILILGIPIAVIGINLATHRNAPTREPAGHVAATDDAEGASNAQSSAQAAGTRPSNQTPSADTLKPANTTKAVTGVANFTTVPSDTTYDAAIVSKKLIGIWNSTDGQGLSFDGKSWISPDAIAVAPGKQSAINTKVEPLGVTLKRLGEEGWKRVLRADPTKTYKLKRVDLQMNDIYASSTIKGQEVRKSFMTLKASSLYDGITADARASVAEIVRDAVERTAAKKAKQGTLPRFPLDAKKDDLAWKLKRILSPAELEHLESINPDEDVKKVEFDSDGNVVYIIDTYTGRSIRDAAWGVIGQLNRGKLDAATVVSLNQMIYDSPIEPKEGSTARLDGEDRVKGWAQIVLSFYKHLDKLGAQ